jgi:hypothetical protein
MDRNFSGKNEALSSKTLDFGEKIPSLRRLSLIRSQAPPTCKEYIDQYLTVGRSPSRFDKDGLGNHSMHALPAVDYLGHVVIDCNAGNHVALLGR